MGSAAQSPLYRRLLLMGRFLPLTAFLVVLAHQGVEHFTPLRHIPWLFHFASQVLFYGAIGPWVAWSTLRWIARRVRERDEAEAQLRYLHEVSSRAALAPDVEALVTMALEVPQQVLGPVPTSLIVRETPEGPWALAGARHLAPEERRALEVHLAGAGSHLVCSRCRPLTATTGQECSFLPVVQGARARSLASVVCLPLSTDRPPSALLNIYLEDGRGLSPSTYLLLRSVSTALAVAMDHVRLRLRQLQTLPRVEEMVRRRDDLSVTLCRILQDIVAAHQAELGAVYLTSRSSELVRVALWPAGADASPLEEGAREALRRSTPLLTSMGERPGVAVPLVAEGVSLGILALTGRQPFTRQQLLLLSGVAGMMALLVRNSQLYAQLESQAVLAERSRLAREVHDRLAQSLGFLNIKAQQVERLLSAGQEGPARQVLRELREGAQDLYADLRLAIQDLRWPLEEGRGLGSALRHYVQAFSSRTGLEVHLEMEGEPTLSPREEVHLLRIVQEALANVYRHAGARRAWVRLTSTPRGVVLEVGDDGRGLLPEDLEAPGHFGLRFIKERAESLGGALTVEGQPGRGTRLRVTIPAVPGPLAYNQGAQDAARTTPDRG